MIKKAVRNLHSDKPNPPRVFDVIVDGDRIDLEVKINKGRIERISWEDVLYQVEAAKAVNK